ncbi:MAG: citramalate synthase [Planctomycetota bacterium]|nr:citramalate synthase [Planctomycetota bacterium]
MSRIQTYDTTLRDGTQGEGVNLSLQDKLMIANKLDELGFDYIEGGYPLSNPKDKEFFERAAEIEWRHAKIAAFGMTRRCGVTADEDVGMIALRDSQAPVITIVGKTWDLHVHDVLRIDEQENLDMIRDSVSYLRSFDREIVYDAEHFFDGWSANPEFALRTIKAAEEAGAAIVVLCDTNGGSLPDQIVEAVNAAQEVLSVPVGIHCHNDCDVAVANSLAAVSSGAIQVQGTINSIGERCGNADLISVIANLALKRGADVITEDGVRHLTELSRYVYEIANQNFRSGQAFVGSSAFAHKGGMHVHAVNRVARSYEHVEPKSVGNVRRVLISELSGRSNIVAKTTKYKLDHDNELMTRILNRVQDMEAAGYQFEAAEASFELLVKKVSGNYVKQFERIHYRVNVETDDNGDTTTEATIKLIVKGKVEHVVAEGDGPVNALDSALRLALNQAYPGLKEMHLVDYKVRVINSAEGTAARVRVVIESADHDDVWNTVGVSENIIEASWLALVDSVEYKLHKDEGAMEMADEPEPVLETESVASN